MTRIKYYSKTLQICLEVVKVVEIEDIAEIEEVFVVEDIIVEMVVRIVKEMVNPKSKRIQMTKS